MDNDYLDLAADFVIFLAGLSLLYALADRLYQVIEEMTLTLIR